MGSCLVYSDTVIAGLTNRANARNVAAPCTRSAKHYYEEAHYCNDDSRDKMLHPTTVLAYYMFDDYWTCSVLVKIYKNICGWEGLIPHIFS